MEGLVAKFMLQRGNGSVDDGVVFFAQCNQFGGRNRFCRIISAILEIGESHSPFSLVLFEPVVGVEDVGENGCIFFGPDADVHGHVLQFNVRRKAVWIVPNRFLNGFVVARLLSNEEPILQIDRDRRALGAVCASANVEPQATTNRISLLESNIRYLSRTSDSVLWLNSAPLPNAL